MQPPQRRLLIHTDGAARGNPGPAGAGAILRDASDGSVVAEIATFLGTRTNNYAEWTAVELALEEALALGATHVDMRMDSELVVRQMQGKYKIKEPALQLLAQEAVKLMKFFRSITFRHVLRDHNREADKLVNQAIDAEMKVI